MSERKLAKKQIDLFRKYLIREEKSTATVEKYVRDVRAFLEYADSRAITKERVIDYKKHLLENGYAVRSVNSMLASLNALFAFLGWSECKVKFIKIQKQIYCEKEKELTKSEYERLLKAAERNEQLKLVMQTICGTGIRVSELRFFTVEDVRRGDVIVNCKGKTRTILIPR